MDYIILMVARAETEEVIAWDLLAWWRKAGCVQRQVQRLGVGDGIHGEWESRASSEEHSESNGECGQLHFAGKLIAEMKNKIDALSSLQSKIQMQWGAETEGVIRLGMYPYLSNM